MSACPDDRIPLRFGALDQAGPRDALLLEAAVPVAPPVPGTAVAHFMAGPGDRFPAHRPGCACCLGRTPAAAALGALFQDRATGRVPWFTRVLAVVRDPAAVADEVRADRLAAVRFRIED